MNTKEYAEVIIQWQKSDIRYLFEGAPQYLLSKGRKFTIFDGPNSIARGEVLTNLFTEI